MSEPIAATLYLLLAVMFAIRALSFISKEQKK